MLHSYLTLCMERVAYTEIMCEFALEYLLNRNIVFLFSNYSDSVIMQCYFDTMYDVFKPTSKQNKVFHLQKLHVSVILQYFSKVPSTWNIQRGVLLAQYLGKSIMCIRIFWLTSAPSTPCAPSLQNLIWYTKLLQLSWTRSRKKHEK